MLRVVCVALLAGVAFAGKMEIMPCNANEYVPDEVRVEGCSGKRCEMKIGDAVHVQIDFHANQDTAKVEYHAFAIVGGIDIEIPDLDNDGCHGMKPACPLKKGQAYTYTLEMEVPANLPDVKDTNITVKATGENGSLGCGKISAGLIS